jgi:hypothetical protein
MITSETIGHLAGALAKVQGSLRPVAMNKTNPFLRNKYADLGAIIDGLRDLCAENGISFVQMPTIEQGVGVTTRIMHESGEWLESTISLPLTDEKGKSSAQAAGSIITYLRRYALAAAFGVVADEDADGSDSPAPPPRNGQADVLSDLPITNNQQKALHALGREVYGDEWDGKRPELVSAITKGRSRSSAALTADEASVLINGMKKKKVDASDG